MKARYGGKQTQLGGKGTERRTKKVNVVATVQEDGKLKAAVKKFGVQNLPDIEEVNMFKDDSSILHFRKPLIQFSVRENLLIVTGEPLTMEKDLASATSDEKASLKDFNGLMAAKTKEINTLTKEIETKIARVGELGVELVTQKEDLDDTSKSFAEDTQFL